MAANANFNTQIDSSRTEGVTKTYILDDVISKDFEGPYTYTLSKDAEKAGFQITNDTQDILNVPYGVNDFNLEIRVVTGKAEAIASTIVNLETSGFTDAKEQFFKSENLNSKLTIARDNWVNYTNTI